MEFKNWGEMSVTNTIFGRWELAVADDAYISNGSGTTRLSRCTDLQYLSVYYFCFTFRKLSERFKIES